MVGIINYELGNLGSIQNMLKAIGEKSMISSDAGALASCDKYILPGVGAFDAGMENLNRLGLSDFIRTDVLKRQKVRRVTAKDWDWSRSIMSSLL